MKPFIHLLLCVFQISAVHFIAAEEPISSFIAEATTEHPRNSEGDILVLRDGTLFAAWSQFYGGAEDHAAARIVAVKSTDGGRTWSQPVTIQENQGKANVMSVSLLRSASGDVLFFYLIKNSLSDLKAYVRRYARGRWSSR